MAEYLGQQLGYYLLVRLLGEGGFARVYLGEHAFLKTQAAIKILSMRLTQEDMWGFLSEARMIARLRHPNIVRVLDFGVQSGVPFLVMEYAPNGTLRQRHPSGAVLPLDVILPYVRQVAEALHYAHEEKLIHRDIKPENMLLGPRNEILLSDFGIATVTQSARYQQAPTMAGTLAYMAPEQIQGHPHPASDQYALGIVVYEWLCGERPFQGTFTEVAAQQALRAPAPLRQKLPQLSPAVEEVLMTALAKDPRDRFADMRAFALALERAAGQSASSLAPRAASADEPAALRAPGAASLAPMNNNLTPPLDLDTRPMRPFAHSTLLATQPMKLPAPEAAPPAGRVKRLAVMASVLLAVLVALSGLGAAGYFLLKKPAAGVSAPYPYQTPTHRGGTITYGSPSYVDTTNPWFALYTVDFDVLNALWGAPLVVSPGGVYLPDELSEIPTQANGGVSKDGLTVVLKLRHDLRWSDGQPLTADDFVYWLEVLLDPATGGISPNGFDQLSSYVAQDPYTLVLSYRQVFAPYLAYLPLAAPRHAWGRMPHAELASRGDVTTAPNVTSGPFMLARYISGDATSGQRFVMKPNPYYASTTLHPSVLDTLIFQNYNDVPSAVAAYRHGQVAQVDNLMPDDLPMLSGLPGLRITPTIGYAQLSFNLTTPPLQDVYVRKAIEEAIDRCKIIQTLFEQPCASLRIDTILPRPSPDFDLTNRTYAFDLKAARADMQAAGWDCSSGTCLQNGQPFPTLRLVAPTSTTFGELALLVKRDLEALGLAVGLYEVNSQVLFADFTRDGTLATGQYDLALAGQVFSIDSDTGLYASFHSAQIPTAERPAGQNYAHVSDTGVDQLLDEGRATLDGAQRSQIYKDVQRILVQKVYVVPLYLIPNIALTSAVIGNYLENPTVAGNEWNVGDWYRMG